MKILGYTNNGYLVETTAIKLAHAAGYDVPHQTPGYVISDSYTRAGKFGVGQIIEATKAYTYINALRQAESRVRGSEGTLRALADLLNAALPTTAIPPESEEITNV